MCNSLPYARTETSQRGRGIQSQLASLSSWGNHSQQRGKHSPLLLALWSPINFLTSVFYMVEKFKDYFTLPILHKI